MGLFDRFKRNKQKDVILPEEVSDYYHSQRRERVGVAVVLGIVALIVTLLVAAGLFFGGRYIYRKIKGNDKPTPVQVETGKDKGKSQNPTSVDSTPSSTSTAGNSPTPSPSTTSPTPSPTPTTPTSSTPATRTSTPSTGDNVLPHTGDPGM